MKKLFLAVAVLATTGLTGCGSVNSFIADRHESEEIYHIFDAKTAAGPDAVIKAATEGVTQNTNRVQTTRPLNLHASKTLPTTPGRFDVIDVADAFKGTGMGTLMALGQNNAGFQSLKQAKCEGALWTAKAVREVTGSNRLDLYICIYRYTQGYNVDMYANFVKTEGGLMQVSRAVADSLVGTPEQWVNKTIVDTMRSIEKATGAKVVHLEGQPEIGGLPWVDKYDSAANK